MSSRPLARLVPLAVALALLASSAPARALEDPDTEIARRHFKKGTVLYAGQRYREALAEFEAAKRVRPSPAFDFNIGRCYDRLEQPEAAVAAYQRYVDSTPTPRDADEVRARIAVLQGRLAALKPPVEPPRPVEPTRPVEPARVPEAPPLTRPEPPARPSTRYSVALPVTIGVVALGALAAGGALWAISGQEYQQLVDSGCGHTMACTGGATQQKEQAAVGLFIAGGALVATDVALWAAWKVRAPVRAALAPTSGGAFLTVGGAL